MDRRKFLKVSGVFAGAALVSYAGFKNVLGPGSETGSDATFTLPPPGKTLPWKNWSGLHECFPDARYAPQSVEELAKILKTTTGSVRAVGSGHSFNALVPTDGTLISLSRLQTGIIEHTPRTLEATIGAGTILADIGEPLRQKGQAFINMPDIDRQSLGGAIATATHGTGSSFQTLSAYTTGFEIVTAKGDVIWCDKRTNPDIFKAAQVNLGALGIITKIRMQNRPPYMLERRAHVEPLDDFLNNLDTLTKENRNVDSFFFPYSDRIAVITYNEAKPGTKVTRLSQETNPLPDLKKVEESLLGWSKSVRRFVLNRAMDQIKPEYEADWSYNIYPSTRNERFHNLEYELPLKNGAKAMRELRDTIFNKGLNVYFPIQFRQVAQDDLWLSPYQGRKSCSISVTLSHEKNPKKYFGIIEKVLQKHGGRPHMGKMHSMTAKELKRIYPHWKDFLAVRQKLDPDGRFLNPHVSRVLGVESKKSAVKPNSRHSRARGLPKPS